MLPSKNIQLKKRNSLYSLVLFSIKILNYLLYSLCDFLPQNYILRKNLLLLTNTRIITENVKLMAT